MPHGPYPGVLDCRPQTLMLNGNSHGPMVLGPTPLTRLSQCTAHTHGRQNTRTQDKNHPFTPTHPLTERSVWVFLRSRCRRLTHTTFQSRIRVSEQSKQAQQAGLSMTTVARMAKYSEVDGHLDVAWQKTQRCVTTWHGLPWRDVPVCRRGVS